MSKSEVKKIVRQYAELLKKNRIRFKQVYLFGSYATGKAHEHSDIDVAVVVGRAPSGKGYLDKKQSLWRCTHKVDSRIEPILLEEKDLTEKEASIMGDEVRRHGILVVTA